LGVGSIGGSGKTKVVKRFCWLVASVLGIGMVSSRSDAVGAGTPTFQFREPHLRSMTLLPAAVPIPPSLFSPSVSSNRCRRAYPTGGDTNQIYLVSSKVSVKPLAGVAIGELLPGLKPVASRAVPGWWSVETGSPEEALAVASRLSDDARILAAYPEMRRPVALHGAYAPAPNDPRFPEAFHLENRNADGSRAGADLNVRAAWPLTHGTNVMVGVVDDGIELTHVDLARAAAGMLHTNFVDKNSNVFPQGGADNHGTAVAGVIAATTDNGIGVSGVAPDARLVAMRVFSNGDIPLSVTDEDMATMFGYRDDVVWVQNHSWGFAAAVQASASGQETDAVERGAVLGRGGKGTVYVRSAGNQRGFAGNANEDGYLATTAVIPVAAVRADGRVASYSSPGANLLVAAPSSDDGFPKVPTTDRTGIAGFTAAGAGDAADYTGFTGTSASAPQVSGVVALMLSVNTNLTARDVQHLLVLSSRHIDLADPIIVTNGAGLRFSENVGYGVPDAGVAVELARNWPLLPPVVEHVVTVTTNLMIPDDGLHLEVPEMPGGSNFSATAGLSLQADDPTLLLPLVDVGQALVPLTTNLIGKGALIQRGINNFEEKIRFAADAGARFAVIYNNTGTTERLVMGLTDFSPIPAVMIGQNSGLLLAAQLAQTNVSARLATVGATVVLPVATNLVCEHVTVRIRTSHPTRGSVRITLKSPAGTIAALQPTGDDTAPGPVDWTYVSAQAFLEPSRGDWSVTLSDQVAGGVGNVAEVDLTVRGVPIIDTDSDGLDDNWEMARFGTLAYGPLDDPDKDGWNNAAEQALGTDPLVRNHPRQVDVSRWNGSLLRLSWPGNGLGTNAVYSSMEAGSPFEVTTNVPSRFPVTEWFVPSTNGARFFRVAE
jgi:subtilisin family serine protease/subtilisin-like proprotein convertase family protein